MPESHIIQLISHAKEGNAHAFGKLYDLYVDQIYKYALYQTKSIPDAQDVTSETFKRAWMHIGRYKHSNFRAYLYAISRNLIIDNARKQKRIVTHIDTQTIEDDSESIEQKVSQSMETKRVKDALATLPKQYAEIIELRFIEGLSVAETATAVGKSSVSVRVTQFRAIKKLQAILNTTI